MNYIKLELIFEFRWLKKNKQKDDFFIRTFCQFKYLFYLCTRKRETWSLNKKKAPP